MSDDCFESENRDLSGSWQKHDREWLGRYLVSGVEDPRINVQSILTRHFILQYLFGDRFRELMAGELRFAVVMNWLSNLVKGCESFEDRGRVLDGLWDKCDQVGDIVIPSYVSMAFGSLPDEIEGFEVSHYINEVLMWKPVEPEDTEMPAYTFGTFEEIWKKALEGVETSKVSVLEAACGSANDYRFIHSFGLSKYLEYTGFDICEKNIANARAMFGDVDFAVASSMNIERGDGSFELCFLHDLLEHLSIEAMEKSLAEICRVTSRAMCLGFFNMHREGEHEIKKKEDYHWNLLSEERVTGFLHERGWGVEVICVDEFLKSAFGCGDTHNKGAFTLIAVKD